MIPGMLAINVIGIAVFLTSFSGCSGKVWSWLDASLSEML